MKLQTELQFRDANIAQLTPWLESTELEQEGRGEEEKEDGRVAES